MNIVLFFQSALEASYLPEKLAGAIEIAEKFDCRIQSIEEPPTAESVKKLIAFWKPYGAIVEGGTSVKPIDPKIFGKLPVVFFNAPFEKSSGSCFSVRHDQVMTGETAARVLMNTGYRHFAYIHHYLPTAWSRERGRAYTEALKLNSYPCAEFRFTKRTSIDRHRELRKFLAALPRPAAVFAANDRVAADVLADAQSLGLAVPDELAVLGVDDNAAICEHTSPTLSSIASDFLRGGRLAMLTLVAYHRAHGHFRGAHERFIGIKKVVHRASTTITKTSDRAVRSALELIRREACNGLTAAEVAAKFPCSRRMADLRFAKATGHSILTEIQAVRLERAKELLSNPMMELKSMHSLCGFDTPNAFHKFFRQETGVTPGVWRKKHR